MRIDRSKFLMLTGALSAVALGGLAATGCSSSTAPTTTGAPGATADAGGTVSEGGTTTDGGAVACLDDTGSLPTCDAANAEATCKDLCTGYAPPSSAGPQPYKAAVARSIAACILAKPTCATLTDADLAPCADAAFAQACEDPTVVAFCAPMVESCGGIVPPDGGSRTIFTKEGCETLAKGLTAAGRTDFTSCVTEGTPGGCRSDPGVCINAFKVPHGA